MLSTSQVFISKIRNCKNKEEERTTVDKELGKVRKKFTSGNAVTGQAQSCFADLQEFDRVGINACMTWHSHETSLVSLKGGSVSVVGLPKREV